MLHPHAAVNFADAWACPQVLGLLLKPSYLWREEDENRSVGPLLGGKRTNALSPRIPDHSRHRQRQVASSRAWHCAVFAPQLPITAALVAIIATCPVLI